MFASILFDILGISNLSRQRYGRKHLAEGSFHYWRCGWHVLLLDCCPAVRVGFCWSQRGFEWLFTCWDLASLLCFLRFGLWCSLLLQRSREGGLRSCVRGVVDISAGCHGDTGSQAQVGASTTRSRARPVVCVPCPEHCTWTCIKLSLKKVKCFWSRCRGTVTFRMLFFLISIRIVYFHARH